MSRQIEWTEDGVKKEWRFFSIFERKFYQYAREVAIDEELGVVDSSEDGLTEDQRLSVASIAVDRVLAIRRWMARRKIDPSVERVLKAIRL